MDARRKGMDRRLLLRLDGTVEELLSDVVNARSAIVGEVWSTAAFYRNDYGEMALEAIASRGVAPDQLATAFSVATLSPPPLLDRPHKVTSITAAHSWTPSMIEGIRICPCADFIGSVERICRDRFVVVGAGTEEQVDRIPRRGHPLLRLMPYLGLNLRVRIVLEGQSPLEAADVVLDPAGRVLGARPSLAARQDLSEIVRKRERAGGFRKPSSSELYQLWDEMSRGELVYLDYVDSDARRFIVGFRVGKTEAPGPALSSVEKTLLERMLLGASNKELSVELGISLAGVTEGAQRALAKLGAKSLSELSAVLRSKSSFLLSDWKLGEEHLVALGFSEPTADRLSSLSKREYAVIAEYLAGRSQREIALSLGISERTVANHIANSYRKIGVSGRRALLAMMARP